MNGLRPVQTFLVSKSGVAIFNTASGGSNITNPSTGNVRLADGQLGLFAATGHGTVDINVALDTTPTITEAPAIYIAQGTSQSTTSASATATYPLVVEPYLRSCTLAANELVSVVKKTYEAPTHSTWVIGQPTGDAQAITALDNTEYGISIAFKGRREDEYYNANNAAPSIRATYVTPDYTTLGTAEPVDHLIQNLAWQINLSSKVLNTPTQFRGSNPVIAFAIMDAGGSGTVIDNGVGTAIDAGEFVPVINTTAGVRGITVTAEQAASIKAAATAAGLSSTATILTVDLTTAGTATGGVADVIMLMALDATLAYEDRIPQVKVRLDVGLPYGFDSNVVYNKQEVAAFEGSGTSRYWDLRYKATHGQRRSGMSHTMAPIIEYPSPIVSGATYVSYQIESSQLRHADLTSTMAAPQKTTVLIPSGDTTPISNFETYLNAWLTSAGFGVIQTM